MPLYHQPHHTAASVAGAMHRRERAVFAIVFVAVCISVAGWTSLWVPPSSSPALLTTSQHPLGDAPSTPVDDANEVRRGTVGIKAKQQRATLRSNGAAIGDGSGWIETPALRLPSFFPVQPIRLDALLRTLDEGSYCGADRSNRRPPVASASLPTDTAFDHYKSCLRTLFQGAYGDGSVVGVPLRGEPVHTQSSAWTASMFRLPQQRRHSQSLSSKVEAQGIVLVMRHHYQPDTVRGLQHTPVANASDGRWASFIRGDVGPDELRGAATLRMGAAGSRAVVVPVGFTYLGHHTEGRADEYLSYIHLEDPAVATAAVVERDEEGPGGGGGGGDVAEATVALQQLHVVHEYDQFWGLNEHQPTALYHVHRDVVRWDLLGRLDVAASTLPSPDLEGDATFDRPLCRGGPAERAVYVVRTSTAGRTAPRVSAATPASPVLRYAPIRGGAIFAATGVGCRYVPYSTTTAAASQHGANRPLIDAASAWQPPLHPPPFSGSGVRLPCRRTAGLRILFTGDSQIRSLFHHWVAVLDNAPVALNKVFNVTTVHRRVGPFAEGAVGGASCRGQLEDPAAGASASSPSSTFLWDAYLSRWARWSDADVSEMSRRFDVMVLGFGSWPASYGQFTLSQVQQRLNHVANVAARLAARHGVVVVYAGSPAWPKHRKHNPGFRITNTRLSLYNAMAKSAFQSALAQVLSGGVEAVVGSTSVGGGRHTSAAISGIQPTPCGGNTFLAALPNATTAATQRGLRTRCATALEGLVRFLPMFDLSITMSHLRRSDGMHYDGSVVVFGSVDALGTILFAPQQLP